MNEIQNENDRPLAWDRQSPDRLMRIFTATPALKWLAVSVAAHLLILGVTSLGYVRDRWIDPEGAKARAAAERASPEEATSPAAAASSAAASATPVPKTEAQLLDDRKDTPVVQRITETADPLDIPRQPDDLGLSLEDTRR